jgi:hypothetical protein
MAPQMKRDALTAFISSSEVLEIKSDPLPFSHNIERQEDNLAVEEFLNPNQAQFLKHMSEANSEPKPKTSKKSKKLAKAKT